MTPERGLAVVDDTPEVRRRKGRSRITNHKDLLPGVKGSTKAGRRFRDLVNSFLADMGGADRCSDIKLGLLRRLAAVTVQSELIEARMINGEPVDVSTLCTLAINDSEIEFTFRRREGATRGLVVVGLSRDQVSQA